MAVTTPGQHNQHPQPHTSSASVDGTLSDQSLQWDGDRIFNVYIWDYCTKRGYVKTAKALLEEAKLEPEPQRPIDTPQGLIYEWWTVFWYIFHAKSNSMSAGTAAISTDDAVLYTQSRLQQPRFQPSGIRNVSGMGVPGVAGPNSGNPGPFPPNSSAHIHVMPNGAGPMQNPQPGQPSHQQPLPPQQGPPLGFPGHAQTHPNGIAPQSGPRGPITGPGAPGQPPRAPGFYQSPTMAHPHTPTGNGQPPYPGSNWNMIGGGGNAQTRVMPPPGAQPNGAANAASPGFGQGGPGSRAPTPAQTGGMVQSSPGMANRPTPQTPPSFGGPQAAGGRGPSAEQINAEFAQISPRTLHDLRVELGFVNKDASAMTIEEKHRVLFTFRNRNVPGPSNAPPNRLGRGSKRSSTSPGNQHDEIMPKDGASPPAQKKVRPSPDQHAAASNGLPGGNAVGQFFPPHGPGAMRGQSFTGNVPPGTMMPPSHPQNPNQQKSNPPFPGNLAPMNKMGGPDQQQYGSDANQPRSAPPPYAIGNQSRQQGKPPGPGMMPPPSSPATGPGKSQKMENITNSPLAAPPSSSGSTNPRGPSPATPQQPSASAPSPSATNTSRPATASSNPPPSAPPPGSGPVTTGPPPAPASAPPGLTDNIFSSSNGLSDFITPNNFDEFTSFFGRDEPGMDFGTNFESWFGPNSDISILDPTK